MPAARGSETGCISSAPRRGCCAPPRARRRAPGRALREPGRVVHERERALPARPPGACRGVRRGVCGGARAARRAIDRVEHEPDGGAAQGSQHHALPGVAHRRLQSQGEAHGWRLARFGGAVARRIGRRKGVLGGLVDIVVARSAVVLAVFVLVVRSGAHGLTSFLGGPACGGRETSRRVTTSAASRRAAACEARAQSRHDLGARHMSTQEALSPQPRRSRTFPTAGVAWRAGSSASSAELRACSPDAGVGLMLIAEDGHTLRYVASSDDVARRLELAHEDSGEGPCVDAFVLDACVKTDDLRDETRWPALRKRAAATSRSARCSDCPRASARPSARSTSTASTHAPGTRARSRRSRPTTACSRRASAERSSPGSTARIVDQLQIALDSRVTIERAIGLLMGRDGIDGADRLQRAAASGAELAPARERRRRGDPRRRTRDASR